MFLHHRVDAVCRREPQVFFSIGSVARGVSFNIHLVRDVQQRLAVLDRARSLMRDVPLSQFSERLHRRRRSERLQPVVEVPLHSVFENNRTRRVLAFGVVQSRADVPEQEIFLRVSGHNAWNLYRIEYDGALPLEYRNRFIHDLSLLWSESTARLFGPWWREFVVE